MTDLDTWGTYSAEMDVYAAGGYDGIGFIVTSGDNYCGVDLDHYKSVETWVKGDRKGCN